MWWCRGHVSKTASAAPACACIMWTARIGKNRFPKGKLWKKKDLTFYGTGWFLFIWFNCNHLNKLNIIYLVSFFVCVALGSPVHSGIWLVQSCSTYNASEYHGIWLSFARNLYFQRQTTSHLTVVTLHLVRTWWKKVKSTFWVCLMPSRVFKCYSHLLPVRETTLEHHVNEVPLSTVNYMAAWRR